MSDFTLTVAFESSKTYRETVYLPVELPLISRMWRKITRKGPLTVEHTYDRPHFHTVTLDDTYDADTFERVTQTLSEKGYTVSGVVYCDGYTSDSLTDDSTGSTESVSALFRGMVEDSYRESAYVAYVLEYGWDTESLTEEWMDDHYHGAWESPADYVRELVSDCYSECVKDLPDWVSVDWEDTADNLSTDYDYVRYAGETHVFSRY